MNDTGSSRSSGSNLPATVADCAVAVLPYPLRIDLKTIDDVRVGNGAGLPPGHAGWSDRYRGRNKLVMSSPSSGS